MTNGSFAKGFMASIMVWSLFLTHPLHAAQPADAAQIRHTVEKGDCPWVGFTEHPTADGKTIVHSPISQKETSCLSSKTRS